jgi:hypothetical protein
MHALLSIVGVIIIVTALWHLGIFLKSRGSISPVVVIIIFGLGFLLPLIWPVFIAGIALALSLFLCWLILCFLSRHIKREETKN